MIKNFFNGSLKEGIFVYVLSIIIFSLSHLIPSLSGTIIFATLLYIPVYSAHLKKIDFFDFGLKNVDWKKSILIFFIFSIIIFPAFAVLYHLYLRRSFVSLSFPKDILYYVFYQITIVGLSEEFFYRGYLQPMIEKVMNKKIFFSFLTTGVLFTSFLFGIGHFLTYFTAFSALTFFPSVVFGVLRKITGNIFASVLFHGISNVLLYVIHYNLK